jgi:soluble cytochrome b562
MKEYFSILTLYLLGIFEYRKYSKGNKELVNTIENIIRWDDEWNLMWTGKNIKEVYERININHSQY